MPAVPAAAWCIIESAGQPKSRFRTVAAQLSRNEPVTDAEGHAWNIDGHFVPEISWEYICSIHPDIPTDTLFGLSPESFFVRIRTEDGRRVTWQMLKQRDPLLSVEQLILGPWGKKLVPWMTKQLDMDYNTLVIESISRETILESGWPYDRWKQLFGVDANFIEIMQFSQWELSVMGWIEVSDELAALLKEQHFMALAGAAASVPAETDDAIDHDGYSDGTGGSAINGSSQEPPTHLVQNLTQIKL